MTSLDPLLWQFFPPHHFPVSLLQRSLATVSAYSTPSCKLLPDDTARNIIVSIGALHPSPRKAWKISPPQSLSGHFVSASYCTSRISQPHIMEIHLNVSSAFFFKVQVFVEVMSTQQSRIPNFLMLVAPQTSDASLSSLSHRLLHPSNMWVLLAQPLAFHWATRILHKTTAQIQNGHVTCASAFRSDIPSRSVQ